MTKTSGLSENNINIL